MAATRSSLLAVTIHTSTGSLRVPPSRRTVRSSSAFRSLAWSPSGRRPTSSRKIVPWCAVWKSPAFGWRASVNAPALVAEELRLEQRLGDGRAVDVDERAGATGARRGGARGRGGPCRLPSRPGSGPAPAVPARTGAGAIAPPSRGRRRFRGCPRVARPGGMTPCGAHPTATDLGTSTSPPLTGSPAEFPPLAGDAHHPAGPDPTE